MQAIDVVTVQQSKTNTCINLTKKIRKAFPVEKGTTLIVKVVDDKIILEKPKED